MPTFKLSGGSVKNDNLFYYISHNLDKHLPYLLPEICRKILMGFLDEI